MYYVYVLQSLELVPKFYLGSAKDLKKRFQQHDMGLVKSTKHTKWKLVYYEAYTSLTYARQREATLKRNIRMQQFLYQRIRESLTEIQP